jgi:hypothetical protein
MVALALPPPRIQEPEKLKRRCDAYSAEAIRVSKKQGSAVVAAPGLGKVNSAPAPSSSSIIREQDGDRRGHGAPGVEHKEEARPCEFAATAYDQEEECCCRLIKKSCRSAMAAAYCGGTNNGAAVGHQVNSARRRVRNNTRPSECKKIYASLASCLRSLGVTSVTPVLAKILTPTDSNLNQARLQISPLKFMKSALPSMLTPGEHADVHTDKGLRVKALDRHGYSYDMALGFAWLSSNITYRLKTGWASFLRRSGVRDGDLVEVGAFRAHGRLMLTLLNYALDGSSIPEAVDGLLMLVRFQGWNKLIKP